MSGESTKIHLKHSVEEHLAEVRVNSLIEQLYANRNDAFDTEQPIHSLVPVAIAGHNESLLTQRIAIRDVYAKQHDADYNPALIFSLNAPEDATKKENRRLNESREQLEELQASLDFPSSYFIERYPTEKHTIGNVRRRETAAGLGMLVNRYFTRIDPDLSVIPGDIDPLSMPGDILHILHEHSKKFPLVQSNIVHARTTQLQAAGLISPEKRFTNSDEVMYWFDLGITFNPFAKQGPYFAMSAQRYLDAGGFDASLSALEDMELQNAVAAQASPDTVPELRLPPELAITSSPRRMFAALALGASPLQAWDALQFQPTEGFRTTDALEDIPDISPKIARWLTLELQRHHFKSAIRNRTHISMGRNTRHRGVQLDSPKEKIAQLDETIRMLGIQFGGRAVVHPLAQIGVRKKDRLHISYPG